MENILQTLREDERRIGEEYLSSLTDLNCNSKPLINMLTMLAEENINYAHVIVRVVEYHISQVPPEFKLPILYLIDSIIKNVKDRYVQLFGQCIVNIFLNAFESVQHSQSQLLEKVRERMYALRQTWNEVFPPSRMYALDVKVKRLDNNWPITAKQPPKIHVNPAIHVNPDFLKTGMVPMPVNTTLASDMEEILQAKTRELLELKKRKLELELEQTKKHLEEQERQLNQATDAIAVAPGAISTPVATLRPAGLYNAPGMRHVRPPMLPSLAPGQQPIATQMPSHKPKVHPVNAALLNSVRQRDPRLARQPPAQPTSASQPAAPMRSDPRLDAKSSHKSSRSRSKSPSRSSGSRSSKSNGSKRSESKGSTASSSSSGSERRKGSSQTASPTKRGSSSRDKHAKSQQEHYALNGSSTQSKRKSNSPASSPTKPKRSANEKSRSKHNASLRRSRSRSPAVYKDVDMRSVRLGSNSPELPPPTVSAIASTSSSIVNDLDKPLLLTTTTAAAANTTTATTTTTTSSTTVTQIQGNGIASDALKQSISKLINNAQGHGGEKRSSSVIAEGQAEEQPLQKRSKSLKLDALFGSEDVDFRRELPPNMPVIVVEDDSMEHWVEAKQSPKALSPQKPTLDELRLKLAKTVRNNKTSARTEKLPEKHTPRLKQLSEVKCNEDSQEAHEEKVRTILTQAQEMYENHNMNQEQYKDLVQKVVAINETSILKEAKRREAAVEAEVDMEQDEELRERNAARDAARDAVLKKRIPKLKTNENQSSPRSDGSPMYEDTAAAAAAAAAAPEEKPAMQHKTAKSKREGKRRKPSKWGEQVDVAQRATWLAGNAQAAACNNNNNSNKRGNFRGNANMRLPVATPWQQQPPFNVPIVALPTDVVLNAGHAPPQPQLPSILTVPPVAAVVAPALTKAINSLDNPMADVVRSITIDGGTKEIRFYNQVAIIFMDGDEPHEIGFQQGQRSICIDRNEPLPLSFNDDYKPFTLDGHLHRIRFGFPSRELYIDDQWYEIYFGGPPVSLPIGNQLHVLKAEGPPPNVDIGRVRCDLVVGKINMVVDAHNIVPLFLDAKVQTFQLFAEQHQLQFMDAFLFAMLDGQMVKIEYGGMPKSVSLNGRKSFIRFGTLPKGVVAGQTHVRDMAYLNTEAPASPPMPPPHASIKAAPTVEPASNAALPVAAAALSNLNIDELFQKLVSSGIIGGSNVAPTAATATVAVAATAAPAATSSQTPAAAVSEPPVVTQPIKRIELNKPETIKTRQSAVVAALYLGMQCSSCGVRFPPEQTIKYSQHLDWHFRQNRRERDSTRKATSRRWYYDLNDWMQYEEIEDVEEREKNFLEAQGQQAPDASDELSNQRSMDSPLPSCAAGADDVDRSCDMCHEKFEQFYNEEHEEWHLRAAIRVEQKTYHPLCYEDYKASLNTPAKATTEATSNVDMNLTDDNAMDVIIKIESSETEQAGTGSSSQVDDDDDDVIVLPNEEPSVTEIVDDDDDDEYVPANVTSAEMQSNITESQPPSAEDRQQPRQLRPQNSHNESANESDVEIQEPNIPFTDLDTYVEKEPQPLNETAFLNVKIKEEPKDDEEDEDDGFEDVGTVVPQPPPEDEISINSSETQTQTIASSASPATLERPPSVASLTLPTNDDDLELEPPHEASTTELNASIDGNGERQETHNLSAAGPAPALPLASLVNKIKINITKNTSSNSNNSASNANNNNNSASTTTTTAAATSTESRVSAISVIGANDLGQVNAIQTISTIPVLCGGNTFVPKITSSSSGSSSHTPANISSISVIGSSYGSNTARVAKPSVVVAATACTAATTTSVTAAVAPSKPKTPPPVEPEPEPVIELKSALRNVVLKKSKKVQSGVETSGLCAIM